MELEIGIRLFQPSLPLRNFVSSYSVMHLDCREYPIRLQPAFPRQYLIFFPRGPQSYSLDGNTYTKLPNELAVGPFIEAVYIKQQPVQLMILANLKPGVLYRLMGIPMHEMLNQPLDGANAFGNEMRKTNEQLSESYTFGGIINIIEAFLLNRLKKAKEILPIDHVFNLPIESPGRHTLDELADLACVSVRQFERQFLNRIGTSPKMFIRQARFARVLQLKQKQPQLSWTSIAYDCGYFDQMHLIRDFKSFAASTPMGFKYNVSGNAAASS